jgi:hypothetical protein
MRLLMELASMSAACFSIPKSYAAPAGYITTAGAGSEISRRHQTLTVSAANTQAPETNRTSVCCSSRLQCTNPTLQSFVNNSVDSLVPTWRKKIASIYTQIVCQSRKHNMKTSMLD